MSLTYRRDDGAMPGGIRPVDDINVVGPRRRTVYERAFKRPIDIVGSLVVLILTLPLMIFVALGVLIALGRPVLFPQVRVTRGGKNFTMLKFRSMHPESKPMDDGEFHAPRDDPRHTPFGQFIRRLSLDELPQLINVLKGDMSLIGPRPELPQVCEAFDLFDHPRHLVRPGMTGPWQVSEYRNGYVHMNVHLDAEYVGDLTFRRDAEIVLRTIGLLFGLGHEALPDGAAPEPDAEDERPIRVLHVLEPSMAGVPAYVEKLGQELADRGVEQIVLTSSAQRWDFADWPERVIRREWRRRPAHALAVAREVRRTVEEEQIDLVHAHATFAGLAVRVRRMPAPVIYQPHGWGHLSTRRRLVARAVKQIEKRLDRRTHTLLTLSEHEAAEAPRARPSERVRPIVELDGFTPLSEIERKKVRLEHGWSPDERIHLCVGELSTRKNQLALAQAWRKLAPAGHRLVLVGDGADRRALEQLTADHVDLLGWRQDINTLMGAADTLVVPSNGEGFSLVILEALATGLPVFATSIGGTEIIGGDDGRVVTTVDEVVRAAVSSNLPAGDPEERAARAQRHHSAASLETVADEFIDIYSKTLGRNGHGDATIDLRAVDGDSSSASLSPR